jgi:uncharacterized protein YyaL (SSP411 family)
VRQPPPSPEEIAALPPDGGPEFNRLVFEESPYLLQHARNPVDWYPWGDEAFARAKAEDKPVFLSVGYSTCHWCHVMEHESFEDEEVAALMNETFVCVKVDREERPDLDHLYMTVTQRLTGSGGWPMTVVMTPGQKPFFAGTYFPKQGRFGRPGMMELVPAIGNAWKTDRENVLASAEEIGGWMESLGKGSPGDDLGADVLELAELQVRGRYDEEEGGFGQKAPKFPMPHTLLFLLQRHQRTGDDALLAMVTHTLRKMRLGGIWDHVGFGFHRYSTDQVWLVPHFEKMLYDQALATMAYTAAWQVTGEPLFRRTAEEIVAYVLRDMTDAAGGFYSAEDADSEGEEGLFYVWRPHQVRAVVGEEDGDLFNDVYGITKNGNFLEEATGERTGRSIPHLKGHYAAVAKARGMTFDELEGRLEPVRKKLFEAREERIHPLKDDKVLTDWNGLMIAALARAAQAFDEPRYEAAARKAADFALAELRDEDGRLFKRWRGGRAGLAGTLEDHAFLTWGLLDLYEATFDVRYLEEALAVTETMIAHFADEESGGFFLSADDTQDLLVRGKEAYDGAIPSGTSVAAWNLLRLARITGRADLEEEAAGALRSHSKAVSRNPGVHTQLMAALDFAIGPSYEVVIAGDPEAEDTRAMTRAFRERFVPHKVLLQRPPGDAPRITQLSPFTKSQSSSGDVIAYVCRDFACKLPTGDVETALGFLDPESWEE